jgi:RNA polymerase sigma-70 factor (sigma-E family)
VLRSPGRELDDEFRSFVLGSQARILRFAELLTGDRHVAEDLAQHGFAKLYASWRRLQSGNPEQYVRRCVINANTDRWRRGTWRENTGATIPERPDQFDLAASLAEHDFVMRALAELAPIERAVIALRYYNDLSEAEIAGELDMPAGTVKSTAARALRKLRAVVDQGSAAIPDNDQGAAR